MHSLSVRRVFLRTTLSLSLSCYPRTPLWSSRKTASIIFILVDAQAFTLSLFLSSTIHHVGNPIRRFLRSVCVCVYVCVGGAHTRSIRELASKILSLASPVASSLPLVARLCTRASLCTASFAMHACWYTHPRSRDRS